MPLVSSRLPNSVPAPETAVRAPKATEFGDLPRWNLDDLYPGRDSEELKADFERVATECTAFEGRWKGKIEAASKDGRLGEAIAEYETLQEVMGRSGERQVLRRHAGEDDGCEHPPAVL